MIVTELKTPHDRRFSPLKFVMALLYVLLLAASAAPAWAQALSEGQGNLRVMTYNVYEGADLSIAFSAQTQQEFLIAVGAILANVQATNPPARAAAIARQIGKAQPTLISLQEVTKWSTCPTADFQTCSGPVLVLYKQRSAILARADIDPSELQTSNIQSAQYSAYLPLMILGRDFSVHRAWISTDVRFHETSFRLIDTQLESFHPGVNYLQGQELINGPAATELPVVIGMDANSPANLSGDEFYPTYANFIGSGFDDAWLEANPGTPGLTSNLLMLPLTKRIDLVLLHGRLTADAAALFGARPSDKTASGLWPSDHVGVAVRLKTRD